MPETGKIILIMALNNNYLCVRASLPVEVENIPTNPAGDFRDAHGDY